MTLRQRLYSTLFMAFASLDVGLASSASFGLAVFAILIPFAYWMDLLLAATDADRSET